MQPKSIPSTQVGITLSPNTPNKTPPLLFLLSSVFLFHFFPSHHNALFLHSLTPPHSPPSPLITPFFLVKSTSKMGFTAAVTCSPRLLFAPLSKPIVSSSCRDFPVQIMAGRRRLSVRPHLLLVSPKATTDKPSSGQTEATEDMVDSNVLPYCSIDRKGKKSLGEMETEFLQALQSFYYDGKAIMSNEEFDNLKEELMWEGSSVVMLSQDEQIFLEASMAYVSGKPMLSDEEYDKLKLKLKTEGSMIVVEGPRCSLRSRKVYSDLTVDYFKMFLLNVPAAVVALGLFFFLDDLTGFEITYLLELPEPFSFIFTWFAALPAILWLSQAITKLIVQDFLILKGPCPNCGTENLSFFGTILSVSSGGATNNVKCANCGTVLEYDSKKRLITVPEGGSA